MTTTEYYNTSYDFDVPNDLSSWMSQISNNKSLANVSIPGTHGSVVYYGGDAYQCQTLPVAKQLQAGLRFLDINCINEQGALQIYQRNVKQYASLADFLHNIFVFLHDNKTECIILNIKPDNAENIENWNAALNSYIKSFGEQKFWVENRMPNMGQARGKIILLNASPYEGIGIRNNHIKLFHEEFVSTLFSISNTWNKIKHHLQSVKCNSEQLFLTFCCGYSWFAYPYSVANGLNQELLRFLEYQDLNFWGIIALDYPGLELVEEIIKSNG